VKADAEMLVIGHATRPGEFCPDALVAMYLLKRYLEGQEFKPKLSYLGVHNSCKEEEKQNIIDDIKVKSELKECVYILDVTPPLEAIKYLCDNNLKVIWYEHHESARTEIDSLREKYPKEIFEAFFDPKSCTAKIIYETLYKGESLNLIMDVLNHADTFLPYKNLTQPILYNKVATWIYATLLPKKLRGDPDAIFKIVNDYWNLPIEALADLPEVSQIVENLIKQEELDYARLMWMPFETHERKRIIVPVIYDGDKEGWRIWPSFYENIKKEITEKCNHDPTITYAHVLIVMKPGEQEGEKRLSVISLEDEFSAVLFATQNFPKSGGHGSVAGGGLSVKLPEMLEQEHNFYLQYHKKIRNRYEKILHLQAYLVTHNDKLRLQLLVVLTRTLTDITDAVAKEVMTTAKPPTLTTPLQFPHCVPG